MAVVAEVRLWGRTIGAVSLEEGDVFASFEYSHDFVGSGIELSPIVMPLSNEVYRFTNLSTSSFHGLPGLLADSLPDKFGNALIDSWLARQGRSVESFNAIERLCYTGRGGMGALEFLPATGPNRKNNKPLQIERLVKLAARILQQREQMNVSILEQPDDIAMKEILQVGTSAGGARAKAVIGWNKETGEIRSGQLDLPENFEHWLLKFDGVSGNRDKELTDPLGYGAIEYAYYKMATDAGIIMSDCHLLEEKGRKHFITKRFDRLSNGQKLHMQSLGALAHFDFNMAGAYSYEQAFNVIRKLDLGIKDVEQMFRRMIFNCVARNQDDHVKNIAFLMSKKGEWKLAPAYDVTYSYQPKGLWTGIHQMSLNGKRDDFTFEDFNAVSKMAGLKRGRAKKILSEIVYIIKKWPLYAEEVGVNEQQAAAISEAHRIKF